MSSRIEDRFATLQDIGRSGLVTFTMAGDPDPETSLAIMKVLPVAGADFIELGMAFSDPMADGPVIEAAGRRALQAGINLHKTLDIVREFRREDDETPVILMGYYNPVYRYGPVQFVRDAHEAGVDGLIIVDLPPEEDAELCLPALEEELRFIRLVTPTTDRERLPQVLRHSSGFLYYVAVAGITGAGSGAVDDIAAALGRIRENSDLPVAVGFGIKTPEQVADLATVADAVVVGSAIVQRIATEAAAGKASADIAGDVSAFVRELAGGLKTDAVTKKADPKTEQRTG